LLLFDNIALTNLDFIPKALPWDLGRTRLKAGKAAQAAAYTRVLARYTHWQTTKSTTTVLATRPSAAGEAAQVLLPTLPLAFVISEVTELE
jgi:hypothetical protein